ncbi:SDR family NAD(P)-dependent oxidoreductase [Leptospira sarikeiensis]|uniref:SDR family NAD(P)-dependent oxidoreductase n=1 Tax=Leptospira sarikeiensis TaxID=2484943 RepID=A0A4R9K0X8_9LEPT|nr:SDR family NAD(P)-dependent oxidoreductase [Leptospira sarikeiensis]TGL57689.1 SDR family NAD(P)-dependent oxidoreductase [Leptospira sarikeiensis]
MKALVLGASGGSGQAIAQELLSRGIDTILFGRSKEKLEALVKEWGNPKGLEIGVGDVFDKGSLLPYFRKVDLVFQAANPGYVDMEKQLIPLGRAVMQAAEETSKSVVFVDGVYVYGKNPGYPVEETYPFKAHTKKGRLKVEFANLVFSNIWKNARALIVRLPDYYGPTSQMAYLNPTFESFISGKPALFFGSLKPKREYVYLPDAAKMIVEISLKKDSYGENWNIPATDVIGGNEILEISKDILGKIPMVIPIGKRILQFLGLFDRFLKEVVEMTYLLEDPLVLSGKKYSERIGTIPKTNYRDGIRITLESLSKKNG